MDFAAVGHACDDTRQEFVLTDSGTPCVITGTVSSTDGNPVPGADVDVWQCDENRTVVPSHYPIPTDGPVGALLTATGRHPYRPAHVHVLASTPGHRELVTHMFVADSPYLESDAVFAVKAGLGADFAESTDPALAQQYGVGVPFRHAHFDVRLCPETTS